MRQLLCAIVFGALALSCGGSATTAAGGVGSGGAPNADVAIAPSPGTRPDLGFVEVLGSIPVTSPAAVVNLFDRATLKLDAAEAGDRLGGLTHGGMRLDPAEVSLAVGGGSVDLSQLFGYGFDDVRADVTSSDLVQYAFTATDPDDVLDALARVEGPQVTASDGTVRISGTTCSPLPSWACADTTWSVVGDAVAVAPSGQEPPAGPPVLELPGVRTLAESLDDEGAAAAVLHLAPYDWEDVLAECHNCDPSNFQRLAERPHVPRYTAAAAAVVDVDSGVLVLVYDEPEQAEAAASVAEAVVADRAWSHHDAFAVTGVEVVGTVAVVRLATEGPPIWPVLSRSAQDLLMASPEALPSV